MNIQPVPDFKDYFAKNYKQNDGKTPPKVNLTKPPIEVNNQDKFVRSDKSVPEKNDKTRRLSVMYSSGGGTN